MQSNYHVIEPNSETTDLSEAPQLYYFADNHHPKMFQNQHHYSCNHNPLPNQNRTMSNSPPQNLAGVAACRHELRRDTTVGHSRPVKYGFRLGLSHDSNHQDSPYDERDFAHLNGEKLMMSKFCGQTRDDEEYSYSISATREPFHWNDFAATPMNDNVCNNSSNNNNNKVGIGERKQFMRLYGDLEAIYVLAKNENVNLGETNDDQTGTNSALTTNPADDNPTTFCDHKEGSNKPRKIKNRKRKRKEMFRSMIGFFERLVENVTSHQDRVHGEFMEAMERIERERSEREEAWRRREAQGQSREAVARVHEKAIASTREALIVSHLEKITGHRVDLPS